ncbi:hypothetical protein [Nocardiopsis halophila]|uniref:hypothetical protein n=1 Tax=Nocardiopsis halophila TaxID=141692 RepID=UPI0003481F5B|nr:hypothetical protein [Nocardiopsis halophila]
MSEPYVGIIVAVLGIAGTLGSAVFTQILAARARLAEIDREQQARAADHERQQADAAMATRRASYIAFNAEARHFHAQIRHCTHALHGQERPDDPWAALDEARKAFVEDYSEIQLTAPERVLVAAGNVNSELNWLYGMVRRLNDGLEHEEESVERAQRELQNLWGDLDVLRTLMRQDLGVTADDAADDTAHGLDGPPDRTPLPAPPTRPPGRGLRPASRGTSPR